MEHSVRAIETTRLRLIPTTVALARAEISNRGEFARLLEATVPDNWPPESIADALPLFLGWLESAPDCGWFGWYALAASEGSAAPVLVGSGGFMGPPKNGTVDIGYSVLTQFQGRGFATEMVGGLLRWALRQPGVARVAAQTEWANPGVGARADQSRVHSCRTRDKADRHAVRIFIERMKLRHHSGSQFTAPSRRARAGVHITAVNVVAPVPSAEEHYGSLKRVGRVMGLRGVD